MKSKSITIGKRVALAASLATMSAAAFGVPIEPGDYVPAPGGTLLGVGYYNYAYSNSVNINGVGNISNGTSANVNSGLLRGVWYPKSSFMPFNVQLLMPFASVNSEVGGANASTNGVQTGDPMFGTVIWPLNDPQHGRYLGIASITSFPLGSYDRFRAVSIGRNAWTEDVQAVFVQKFASSWEADVAGDAIIYGNNNNYGTGANAQTLQQRNTYELQLWVSKNFSPLTSAGVGYTNVVGGRTTVEGQPTGLATSYQQVRVFASHFIAPTWQVLGEVNHAFATKGGFNQTFGMTLRLLKLF
jgi:hypothetical protein